MRATSGLNVFGVTTSVNAHDGITVSGGTGFGNLEVCQEVAGGRWRRGSRANENSPCAIKLVIRPPGSR